MNSMAKQGSRMFSTVGIKSYRAYKAPEYWKSSFQSFRTGAGSTKWSRHYHRHSVSVTS